MVRALSLSCILLLPQFLSASQAQTARPPQPALIEASVVRDEVTDFLTTEMAAHLSDIQSYEPPPDKVHGAGATGEYLELFSLEETL